jgi:hypothetical protein
MSLPPIKRSGPEAGECDTATRAEESLARFWTSQKENPMEPQESRHVDKAGWPRGEWDNEPDRIEWRSGAFACLIVRSASTGALCGYVGTPPGHPWHGKDYNDEVLWGVEVHGGLTYAAPCVEGGHICHVPQPGEPDAVHWLGFDCGHSQDISPAFGRLPGYSVVPSSMGESYKPVTYVRRQVELLANQARAAIAAG